MGSAHAGTGVSTMPRPVRKIVYVSGTRADFGLMKSTLLQLHAHAELSIAVTGMHLSPLFGRTIDDIRASGLRICAEVPVDVTTRTASSMAAGVGACLIGLTEVLQRERPNIVLLLGDRGEMLAGAIAALHLGIVCVHIHGGERSGTVDEPVRHAISKLSHYHLVATQESRDRLIRMGEPAESVKITGAPGLDGLTELAGMPEGAFLTALGLAPQQPFILAIFHPVVQEASDAYTQVSSLLSALKQTHLPVIWLEPNADAGSADILKALSDVGLPQGSHQVKHLPRNIFCAAMKYCAVMVGNSSAGIIEAATFATPVVNIGRRQQSRETSANVVTTDSAEASIQKAITAALAAGRVPCENKYGDGRAGLRIVDELTLIPLGSSVLNKCNSY